MNLTATARSAEVREVSRRGPSDSRPRARRGRRAGRRMPAQLRTAATLTALWLVVMLITAISHPQFLSSSTFLAIAFNMAVPGVVALGLAFVTTSGTLLDLSTGVVVAGGAVLTATLLRAGLPTLLVVVVALFAGIAAGLMNATLVAAVGINPIVATLATSFAGGGLLVVVTAGTKETVPSAAGLESFGIGRVLGIPYVLLLLVLLAVAAELSLVKTRPGRRLVAVGGNKKAASARGINVRRVRVVALALSGMFAALGGVLLASESTSVPSVVDTQLAYRVAAIVLLGGISLTGGRGRILGLFASLLLLSSVPTVIVQYGISSSWQAVLEGAALFIAVSLDARRFRGTR